MAAKKDIVKISRSGVKHVNPDELVRQESVKREVQELKRLFRKENGNGSRSSANRGQAHAGAR